MGRFVTYGLLSTTVGGVQHGYSTCLSHILHHEMFVVIDALSCIQYSSSMVAASGKSQKKLKQAYSRLGVLIAC